MREIKICEDKDECCRAAAEAVIRAGNAAIATNGRFTIALSGGSTPASLYSLLAGEEYRKQIDWTKVFFFFGDERMVPTDSAESNCRMAREALLTPVGAAESNIFRWRTELGAETAAVEYEKTLCGFFGIAECEPRHDREWPRFDLILLGLGSDGHTASLFPHSPALQEISRFAVPNAISALGQTRLTLTFPVINNASLAVFLVTGTEKKEAVNGVIRGEFRPDDLPAQLVQPLEGSVLWLLDKNAGEMLQS